MWGRGGVGVWGVRRVTTGEHKCNSAGLPVVPHLSLKTGVLEGGVGGGGEEGDHRGT